MSHLIARSNYHMIMNKNQTSTLSYCITALICLMVLSSCTSSIVRDDSQAIADKRLQAEQWVSANEYVKAAETYLQMAELSTADQYANYLLNAVELYQKAKEYNLANKMLMRINTLTLSAQQLFRYQLTKLASYTYLQQWSSTLPLIESLNTAQLSSTQKQQLLNLSALSYGALDQPELAIKARLQLNEFLQDSIAIEANQLALWQLFTASTDQQFTTWQQTEDSALMAWTALAKTQRISYENEQQLVSALDQWRHSHPTQFIGNTLIKRIISEYTNYFVVPEKIAVLLPMSGKYSKIANVIYAGILSAKELNEHERYDPEIVLYDTGVQNQNILEHYQLAIDQGAEYVIGPLDKEAVETLATQADISVPTLTLNYLPDHIDTPNNLYQFGLLPEDEAIQVAQRAFMDGHQHTLILSAQGDWQSRLTDTFINHYEELGGQVLDTQYYMTNNSDFSETLKDVLHINESEQRYQQLRSTLGMKIKHQSRRRQDAQAVFLIAPPKTARLIRPQINYYFGTDLSVYSTSHIFSGTENITKDRDINGVTYTDIPWILDPKLSDEILRELLEIETGRDYKDHPRFAALGIDAYNLPMQITTLLAIENTSYSGLTGQLSIHNNNRLYRELLWGKFINGRPRLLKSHSH